MFWKQISKVMQFIGKVAIAPGIIVACFALACGELIPLSATGVMIAGLFIWLIGLLWETWLDMLCMKREQKRIRR